MIPRFLLPLLTAGILFAQDPSANPQAPDLKAFLNLSDTQIQNLAQVQQKKGQALQPVMQETAQNQQKLQQLLAAPNPDPATVGRLLITIATLGQQAQQIAGGFQAEASNLLTSDQKTKLPPLQLAVDLHPAALQAASLGLLNAQ